MKRTIWLYVYGENDFSADWFQDHVTVLDLYHDMEARNQHRTVLQDDDGDPVYVEIKEFGDVALSFVNFIREEICKESSLEARNIFFVKSIWVDDDAE